MQARVPSAAKWCHGCHGIARRGTAHPEVPNLAGQKVSYLIRQLELFQKGKGHETTAIIPADEVARHNRTMKHHADKLSRDEILAVATFYSSQPCAAPPITHEPIPANRCTHCHGNNGISESPDVPNLAGQNIGYLLAQAKKFHEASFGVDWDQLGPYRQHPLMTSLARKLNWRDVATLYAYAGMACRQR